MGLSALAALLLGPGIRSASAEATVRVLEDTPVSPVADIPADVRKECTGLGDELPRAIARANPRVTMVRTTEQLRADTGKYLSVEIIQVKARAAGALSGPKKVTVRGTLVHDGKQVADFEAERSAMEAAGTCRTLNKAEKELGADIGTWLMAPRPHSRLGDR